MFFIKPAAPFTEFNEDFEFLPKANIMRNLMQYCGYWTLHPNCWLYKWLQSQIKMLKFSGGEEFKKWCTYPPWYDWATGRPPWLEDSRTDDGFSD